MLRVVVFELTDEELIAAVAQGKVNEEGRLIKLRGLPFSANEEDVKEFLKGLSRFLAYINGLLLFSGDLPRGSRNTGMGRFWSIWTIFLGMQQWGSFYHFKQWLLVYRNKPVSFWPFIMLFLVYILFGSGYFRSLIISGYHKIDSIKVRIL